VVHQSAGYGRGGKGRRFDEGEMKGWDISSVQLHLGAGGWHTAAHDAVVHRERRRRLGRPKMGEDPGWANLGQRPERLGLCRPGGN
jgi:hypothetical protein